MSIYSKRVPKLFMLFAFIFSLTFQTQAQITGGGITGTAMGGGAAMGGWNGGVYGGAGVNPLWGSGAYGGLQGCNMQQSRGKFASSSADEKRAKRELEAAQKKYDKAERARDKADREKERFEKEIRNYFSNGVADFLVKTHIGGKQKCSDYRLDNKCQEFKDTAASSEVKPGVFYPPDQADLPEDVKTDAQRKSYFFYSVEGPNGAVLKQTRSECGSATDVHEDLLKNWRGGKGYCNANSDKDRGSVKAAICEDKELGNKSTWSF